MDCFSDSLKSCRLTTTLVLHYPAWLLTPRELCSQIDTLFLWAWYGSSKLSWNIHVWVHLAESSWCSVPKRTERGAVQTCSPENSLNVLPKGDYTACLLPAPSEAWNDRGQSHGLYTGVWISPLVVQSLNTSLLKISFNWIFEFWFDLWFIFLANFYQTDFSKHLFQRSKWNVVQRTLLVKFFLHYHFLYIKLQNLSFGETTQFF